MTGLHKEAHLIPLWYWSQADVVFRAMLQVNAGLARLRSGQSNAFFKHADLRCVQHPADRLAQLNACDNVLLSLALCQ